MSRNQQRKRGAWFVDHSSMLLLPVIPKSRVPLGHNGSFPADHHHHRHRHRKIIALSLSNADFSRPNLTRPTRLNLDMSAVSPLPNLKRTLRKSVQQILKTIPAPSVAAQCQSMHHLLVQQALSLSLFILTHMIRPHFSTFAANAILATLLTHPAYTASRSLSIYLSLPNSEIETLSIVQHALSQGKNVFVPWTPKKGEGDGRMRMVRVERDEVGEGSEGREKWERDGWGIPVVGLDRKGKPRDDGEYTKMRSSAARGCNAHWRERKGQEGT